MRETSIAVYNKIIEEGLLSRLRLEVYEALFKHGPMTQMELCSGMNSGHQDRSYMPRFAELERMGAIKVTQERVCRVTGRTVLEWDVTNKVPTKLEKKTKIKKIKFGQFELSVDKDQSLLWIRKDGGEACGLTPEQFEKYWDKNF